MFKATVTFEGEISEELANLLEDKWFVGTEEDSLQGLCKRAYDLEEFLGDITIKVEEVL